MSKISLLALSLLVACNLAGCGKKEGGDASPAASASAAPAEEKGVLGKLKDAVSSEVTITKKPVAVGAKRKIEETGSVDLKMKMGAREMTLLEKEVTKRTEEVLAVEGNIITKLKVSYEAHTKEVTDSGKSRTVPDTLAGKEFIIESVKGKVNVTSGDGKPAAGPAKLAVLKEFKQFGKEDKFETGIPSRPLKVGDEVPELGAPMTEQLQKAIDEDARSGMTVDPPKTVLKSKEGDLAVFEVTTTARSTRGMMKGLVIPLTVSVAVRTSDGRVARSTVDGTMGLSPEEKAKNKNLTLDGVLKKTQTATYP